MPTGACTRHETQFLDVHGSIVGFELPPGRFVLLSVRLDFTACRF
uniref:Uncharacterized protein n=1 Tax=Arundo donax TaxID=35708 RepID=A0A0A8ZF67_ARUDO